MPDPPPGTSSATGTASSPRCLTPGSPARVSRACSAASGPCCCRERHPCRSGGVPVFVEDAAEAITSADVEMGYLVGIGDRGWQRMQWPGIGDALVRAVSIVELFEFVQGLERVSLVPDQRPIQEFAAAGLNPSFHDRV